MKRISSRQIIIASVIASFLFLSINIFLIVKEDSKANRIAYINNWDQSENQDIIESYKKEAIVESIDEQPIYFDENQGKFNQFLVKEGDEVTVGSALYEYQAEDVYAEEARLVAEMDRLEQQIDAVDDHIDELEAYKKTITITEEDSTAEKTAYYNLDSQIYEKNLEAETLENELNMLENQLQFLEEQPSNVTVQSSFSGVVKEVNTSLTSPLMIISSDQVKINGELVLKERKQTEIGMRTVVSSSYLDKPLDGSISHLSQLPKRDADVDSESIYTFDAVLDEVQEDLLIGTPVTVEIVTEEVADAVSLPTKILRNNHVLVLTNTGKLERRNITRGIEGEGKTQIEDGLTSGEYIVTKSFPNEVQGSPAAVSLQGEDLSRRTFTVLENQEIVRYLLKGLITR